MPSSKKAQITRAKLKKDNAGAPGIQISLKNEDKTNPLIK